MRILLVLFGLSVGPVAFIACNRGVAIPIADEEPDGESRLRDADVAPVRDAREDEDVLLPRAAPPTIAPDAGFFSHSACVSITTTTPDAAIHYSLDGSTPAIVYTEPFLVPYPTTVRAIAVAPGFLPSEVASAAYFVQNKGGTLPVFFTPPSGTFPGPIEVRLESEIPPSRICYVTDGTVPRCNADAAVTCVPNAATITVTPPDGGVLRVRAIACGLRAPRPLDAGSCYIEPPDESDVTESIYRHGDAGQ